MGAPHSFAVSVFDDVGAHTVKQLPLSLEQLSAQLSRPKQYARKADCPLLKLARFGNLKTKSDSLRHDANVEAVTGIEGDHDAGTMSIEAAAARLRAAGIQAIVYTSASNTEEHPRWRVLAPLSREYPPAERKRFAAWLNGVLNGVLAPESFTLSQSYYFGRVNGAPYECVTTEGEAIDLRPELEFGAIYPSGGTAAPAENVGMDFDRAASLAKVDIETIAELRSALHGMNASRADDRHEWINVGHALASLKATSQEAEALELWHEFSRRSDKYDAAEADAKWADMQPSRITYRSIFELAQRDGWVNPRSAAPAVPLGRSEVEERRRHYQQEENKRIGEGLDAIPAAEVVTLEAALERFVFLADGSRVADLFNPHYDLAYVDWAKTYSASRQTIKPPKRTAADGTITQPADKEVPVAELWCGSPKRLTVVCRTFKADGPLVLPDPMGRRALNLWKPFDRSQIVPDLQAAGVDLFLGHVEFLFSKDAPRFLDWLAHIEQRPGELPHTAWLHIARYFGLGRNWLASVLTRVWAGSVAANFDLPATLRSGFNDRLSRKVLAVVDEIREGARDSQWEHSEKLKSTITEEFRHINPKFGRQSVEFNSCRWLMFSNHYSAIPIEHHDRRIEVVSTDERPRDPGYYSQLYRALNDPLFIAAIATYLGQRDISRFNPGAHAVLTDAKKAATEASQTPTAGWCELLVNYWPSDLITSRDLYRVLEGSGYGEGSLNAAHRRTLEQFGVEAAGKPLKLDGRTMRVSILRNRDRWKAAYPDEMRAELLRSATKDFATFDDPRELLLGLSADAAEGRAK